MLLKLFEAWIDAVGLGWETLGTPSRVCRHRALSPAFKRSKCGLCGCLRGVVQLSACADHFLTSPKPGAALGDRGSSFQYRQTLCGTVWFCSLPQRKCVRAECPGRALEQRSAGDTRVLQQHRHTSSFAGGGAQGCVCAALSLPAPPQQPPWQGRAATEY